MKRMIKFLILGAMAAFVQTGCVNDKMPGTNYPGKADGPVFNFATEATYSLNFQYNVSAGYVVGFDVYTQNPFETDADGQFRLKEGLEPVDRGFTDDRGSYNAPLTLPSYVKQIYIYTSFAGVGNRLLTAKVENGQLLTPQAVEPGSTEPAAVSAAKSSTRAGVTIDARESNGVAFKNLAYQTLTLGKWYVAKDGSNPSVTLLRGGEGIKIYGRPMAMSYVDKTRFGAVAGAKDALAITPEILKSINKALPGDGKGAVDPIYLKTGDINVAKEAELDLVFIQNWGAYYNTLAYYCYDTNNPPSTQADIKYQVVAIPNVLEQKSDIKLSSYFDVAAIYQGEGVKLKYVDQNGQMQDKFPAGTSVGWILYRNGFSGYAIASDGPILAPSVGVGANFSSTRFGQQPNTAVLRTGDFVVIGFDDGEGDTSKRDYLDVVFNVQSTPSDAITEEIPDVDPEDPKPVVVKKMGVLLYEDLWPFQGDFDMNDVVVKYVAEMTKNKDNKITDAKIDFTIVHSGASYNNDLLYQDDNLSNATVTVSCSDGVALPTVDKGNNIVRVATKVLDFANKAQKATFTVNYKFTSPIDSFDVPLNPFISIGDNAGKEVHLTNHAPSPFADMSWFSKRTHDYSNPDLGLYYITYEKISDKPEERGQQLPFAVNIVFENQETMNGFKVTEEGQAISRHYPGFVNWVRTNGKENADWYLHYKE